MTATLLQFPRVLIPGEIPGVPLAESVTINTYDYWTSALGYISYSGTKDSLKQRYGKTARSDRQRLSWCDVLVAKAFEISLLYFYPQLAPVQKLRLPDDAKPWSDTTLSWDFYIQGHNFREYLTSFPIYRDRVEQIFRQYGLVAVSGTNAYRTEATTIDFGTGNRLYAVKILGLNDSQATEKHIQDWLREPEVAEMRSVLGWQL
ncbi:hypothetical protein [Leptolyngbya ohadii]|uniref:hypothetical protein n=1 Tax=Leptolyngbya ohadii TaxID=1962290 RepID=UPI000B59B175|nr:hypothetical protein [Leptolyngbya ohadii]